MIENKFRILNDLGAGATAEVKCVEDMVTGEQLACKIMRIDSQGQVPEVALAEAMIGFKINHPNVINIRGIGRGMYNNLDGQPRIEVAYILMENMKQGELLNVLMNSGKFSESTARYFFKQILSALSYMHNTVGVCHRDLKLDNIRPGSKDWQKPAFYIHFYDKIRRSLGDFKAGPWLRSQDWERTGRRIPVPVGTREAIVRIGLNGAAGTMSVDDLRLSFIPR